MGVKIFTVVHGTKSLGKSVKGVKTERGLGLDFFFN